MEIERKYLIEDPGKLPQNYQDFPFHEIEQAYLCTNPVVRIRREDEQYYLTYKGKGLLAREEYNLPLTKEAYEHLLPKADGIILQKRRSNIPLIRDLSPRHELTIELDIFHGDYEGFYLAEVEFASVEESKDFTPPLWFGEDVSGDFHYSNSYLAQN